MNKTFRRWLKTRFKSPTATNIIAYGETICRPHTKRPDAESVEQISVKLLLTFSERLNSLSYS